MSQCPYTNLLDPDLYGAGNHLQALSELRAQADAPIIKIEDPLAGVPYWAVLHREHVDYIAKHPAIFSSEKRLTIPPLSRLVPGRGLRVSRQTIALLSACQSTSPERTGRARPTDQQAGRSLPRTPGVAGTGCRERLARPGSCRRHRRHAPDPGQFRLLPDRSWPAAGTQSLHDPHHPATGSPRSRAGAGRQGQRLFTAGGCELPREPTGQARSPGRRSAVTTRLLPRACAGILPAPQSLFPAYH